MPKGVPGSAGLCAVAGCDTRQIARVWCRKHYYRWKRTGRTDDPPPPAQGCLVEGCQESHSAYGYCGKHASRWRVHGDPLGGAASRGRNVGDCAVPGCNQPSRKRGWCTMHYQRYKKTGDAGGAEPRVDQKVVARNRELRASGNKLCSQCMQELPVTDFYRDIRAPDGLTGRCKECRLERQKQYHQEHRAERNAYAASYRADPEHRRIAREKTAKWRAENPEWQRENLARWRAIPENQQLARERSRAWRIANPKRRAQQNARRNALEQSGQATRIPMELLEAKLAYWGWHCWIAGPACTGDPEQWDHVKPLSKGGAHLLANLRPACQPCNFGKRAQWPFPTSRLSASG
jgi:hypothetical protein